MRFLYLPFYLLLASPTGALQQPTPTTTFTKACASVALCTSLLTQTALPVAADDGASIRVEVNRPYIVELLRNKQERQAYVEKLQFVADGAKYVLEPIVKVELPTNTKDFVKDALRGKADVKVNGLDFAVKVVASEKGSVTVQLSSDLLPRLPVVGLPGTSPVVNAASEAVSEAVSDSTPVVLDFMQRVQAARQRQLQRPPFWTTPINAEKVRLDLSLGTKEIHRAITPLDIAGVASLGVGAAYGASYWYYLELQSAEERASAEKKQKAAEKKKKAPATEAVVEAAKPLKPAEVKKAPKKVEKKEKIEVAAATSTVEPPLLQTRVRRSFGQKKLGFVRRLFKRS
ncbi:hypothetical protein FisN_13Hh179 [Fistulifera solaris]|uniref:Uncharacterized protein n=1 Tax=Fistulifera solaris TaxID=1519565 RepID=A0A1Z5KN11_FISSO|nr:hypothetical protein FisN_13Hh179 [Fistulifera solaris]|eukprot:GAX27723.1 hypothetical protein FisN_13Hh179 [Fistulifera solaris]